MRCDRRKLGAHSMAAGGVGLALVALAMLTCAPRREGTAPPKPEPAEPAPEPAPSPTAEPVPPPPAVPVYLHASKAKIHGRNARYEKRKDRDNIGFWTNFSDFVTWDFDLGQPGTYLVQVTLASPNNSAGSSYAVEIGDWRVEAVVPPTGDWTKFITVPVGVVELTGTGTRTVAVKPVEKRSGALMNLQAVTLKPGDWQPGLVAWWRFDEGKGTETEDYMGGATDAVRHARWTRGASRSGLKLNGVSSHVVREAAFAPDLADGFTIEAWVKLDTLSEGWRPIVNRHAFPLGFFFGFDADGDLGLHLGVGGKWAGCTSSVRPQVGRWTHVAATFDTVEGIRLFVDGEQTGRRWVEGTVTPAEDTDLLIGRHNHHPWALHGTVDEVRLYDRPLRPEALRKQHAAGRATLQPPPHIAIKAVRPDRTALPVYQRLTLELDLQATFDNPFDADDIRVDCGVATPSGQVWSVPGFLYQPFERKLEKGEDEKEKDQQVKDTNEKEVIEPAGEPRWQVRLSLAEAGTHHLRVTASDRTGTAMSEALRIDVTEADVAGMVRCRGRYFATDRGESFFPVGANVCWGLARGTFNYDGWLATYAERGCNFFRVWLSPHWTTFAMQTAASGFDGIDLANAWRLDHVVETAERLGLRVLPCIDSFNILRTIERSPGVMEEAPTTRANGGPVATPRDYFTRPASREAYRNRVRYLVARYGYSPAVFGWEFWNEVDIIDGYDSATVAAWHAAMGDYLKRLDPWQHPVSTSHAKPEGDPAVDVLPVLDFVMTHRYHGDDLAHEMTQDVAKKLAAKTRPHFHGEFGIAGDGTQTAETDPTGIHLHNALYASVGAGSAGGPMTWWWDSYVAPKNLYLVLGAFARWIDGFDFVAQQPRKLQARISGETETVEEGVLELVKGTWDPASVNQPLKVVVGRKGIMTAAVTPSELLQGLGFHKTKHNPVTFQLDVPEATTFGVEVAKYSGYGNGHLEIRLDKKLVLEKDFPIPKGNTKDTLTEGAGLYEVKLPKGKHTVKVANTGKDWISLTSYRIPWLKVRKRAVDPLRVSGLAGETMALIWVQNKLHTWKRATAKGYKPVPVEGAHLKLSGLAPGPWTVKHWDTHKGQVTKTEAVTVAPDGTVSIPLPAVAWDAAFRLRRSDEKPTARTGD